VGKKGGESKRIRVGCVQEGKHPVNLLGGGVSAGGEVTARGGVTYQWRKEKISSRIIKKRPVEPPNIGTKGVSKWSLTRGRKGARGGE